MWLTRMVHKIGQNLISNSAPCQHFIWGSSTVCEPAVAFPIQTLQRNEKQGGEEKTGEQRSGSVPSLSSAAQPLAEETQGWFPDASATRSHQAGIGRLPLCVQRRTTSEKACWHSECLLIHVNNNKAKLALSPVLTRARVTVNISSDHSQYSQHFQRMLSSHSTAY